MGKNEKITVNWLVNHMIHNWHDMVFLSSEEPYDVDHVICEWNDDYYREHKEELYKMNVTLITVTDKKIRVFVKE